MNLLARAKLSAFSSSVQRKRLLNLFSVTAFQQCEFYSTRTAGSAPKVQETKKASRPPWFCSQKSKKGAGKAVWPKPVEIPFQAKVANFVNLIGHVDVPVTFETSLDGKQFASTSISVRNGGNKGSMSIPVVFEGDLAHVVACHVKKSDCVFVSGYLSSDSAGIHNESLGKLHLVGENVNFVEGLDGIFVKKKVEVPKMGSGLDEYIIVEETVEESLNIVEKEKIEENVNIFEKEKIEENVNIVEKEMNLIHGNDSPSLGEVNEKAARGFSKKNDAAETLALWRDLVTNPLQWWDFRTHKANKLVKDKHPDFKQKVTNAALWINTAPEWVLSGLGKLEFDVLNLQPKQFEGERSDADWKNLLENPGNWVDYRANRTNPKFPDFKHKVTGAPIWLNKVPAWALDKLPPRSS